MKKITFLVVTLLSIYTTVNAQTVFWTETFGTGCNQGQSANAFNSGNGAWTVTQTGTNAANANMFYVSSTEAGLAVGVCGDGCLNTSSLTNATLHIANVASSPSASIFCPTGDCGAGYDSGGGCGFGLGCVTTNTRAESPVINCTGYTGISINFKYFERGQGTTDDATLWYFDGTTWAQINALAKTPTGCANNQGKWTAFTMALPASADNNPNIKVGFKWVNNDDGLGSDPSFAVDDVTLSIASAPTNPVATITPVGTTTVCANSTVTLNGSATNGPITGWAWTSNPSAGVSYSPSSSSQNVTVSFTNPGAYTFTLTATNASGSGTATQTVSVTATSPVSVALSSTPATPVCEGTPIALQASPTGGGLVPTYTWFENGVQVQSNNIPLYNTTANNNDTIIVQMTPFGITCPSPAIAADTFVIQTNAPVTPAVNITANPSAFCAGTNVTFTANPANGGSNPVYAWLLNGFPVSVNNTYSSSALADGDTLIVDMLSNQTCVTGNTATDTLIISVLPSPDLSVVNDTVSTCPNGPVALIASANAGSSFSWSPSTDLNSTTNDTVLATISATGYYTYTVTASVGSCTETDSVVVNVSNNLTTTINGPSSVCLGDSVQLGVANGTSWSWLPAAGLSCTNCPNPMASPAVSTVYTVNITSGACTASATHSLTVNSTATGVSISSTPAMPVCEGSPVAMQATPVNGGSLPTYTWFENGVQMQSSNLPLYNATANNGDTIIVQMASNGNCPVPAVAVDTFIIQTTAPVTPAVSITANPATFCANTNVTFTANPANGGTTPTYVWQLNHFPVGVGSTYSNASPADGDSVIVTMLSSQLCTTGNTASDTFVVHVQPSPNLTVVQGSTTVCPGSPSTLIVSAAAGSSFSWNPATNLDNTTNDTVVATINTVGSYTYAVTSTLGACTETQSITVTVSNNLTASINGPSSLCAGSSAQLTENGGTAWNWSPAAGLSCTTCQNPVASPTANTEYTVNVTSGSCTASATHSITVNAEPTINVPPASMCAGNTVQLQASGIAGTNYQWNPGSGLSCNNCNNPTASPANTTTYTVIGTDANGCDDTTSVVVTVNPSPVLTVVQGNNSTICLGSSEALIVNASPGSTLSWTPAANLSTTSNDTVVCVPTAAGATQYTVTATLNSCTSQQTVSVTASLSPGAAYNFASANTGLPQAVSFNNTSTNASSYAWSFGDGSGSASASPSHTYTAEGTYTVTLIASNSNGCGPDTISYQVIIVDGSSVVVPNIFTPNGDLVNETLDIKTKGISELTCTIFDRWGLKVVEITGTSNPKWDGKTAAGNAASEGTYFYVLKATGIDSKTFDLSGSVLLVK